MKLLSNIIGFVKGERGIVLADQAVFSLSSLTTTLLLAHNLFIGDFGLYSQVMLLTFLIVGISAAVVVSPFQVLLATKGNKKQYFLAALCMQALIATAVFLLVVAVAIFILKKYNLSPWPVAGFITGYLLFDFFRKALLAMGRNILVLVLDILNGVSQCTLLALLIYTHQLTLNSAFVVMAITYLPAIALAFFFTPIVRLNSIAFVAYLQQHIATGKWYVYTAALQWFSQNFIITAAGIYLGASVLAAFRLAQSVFGVFNSVLQVFENYTLPKASAIYHSNTLSVFSSYLKKLTVKSLIVAIPVIIGFIVFAKPIFNLAGGSQYTRYAYILQCMGILYLLVFLSNPVRIAIRVLLLNKQFFTAHIFSFICSLLFAFFAVERFSILGVIGGLVCNQLVMLIYWQYILNKKNVVLWK